MSKFYHYTKSSIKQSIEKNQEIWLSNILNQKQGGILNQKQVGIIENIDLFIKPYYFQAVKELKKQYVSNKFIQALPTIFEYRETGLGMFPVNMKLVFENSQFIECGETYESNFEFEGEFNCYVFCVSTNKNNDYLKTYYAEGKGKPLKIDEEWLKKCCINTIKEGVQSKICNESNNTKICLSDKLRLYNNNKKSTYLGQEFLKFRKMIYKKEDKINKIKDYILFYEKNMLNPSDSDYTKKINLLKYELFIESMFFKEDGFELEEEARLVLLCPTLLEEVLKPKDKDKDKDNDKNNKHIVINIKR